MLCKLFSMGFWGHAETSMFHAGETWQSIYFNICRKGFYNPLHIVEMTVPTTHPNKDTNEFGCDGKEYLEHDHQLDRLHP